MSGKKTDNAFLSQKRAIRNYFLEKYFKNRKPMLLDCCAGYGEVWRPFLKKVLYTGCDVKKIPGTIKTDSKKMLAAETLFDIYDIDTYGSPWEHLFILLENKKHQKGDIIVIFLTIGSTMMKVQQKKALEYSGLFFKQKIPSSLPGFFEKEVQESSLCAIINHGYSFMEVRKVEHQRVSYITCALRKEA